MPSNDKTDSELLFLTITDMAKFHHDADSEFLYARIVSRIEQQIKQDLLIAGDKLPSLRALSQEQAISLSTAFKAYVELENMGLIEARPKSGYYVKFTRAKLSKVPETSLPTKKTEQASVTEMIAMVYRNMSEATVLGLSRAAPPLNLIPVAIELFFQDTR